MTVRLDVYLTERGLAPSRHRAAEWIRNGCVTINGQVIEKPSHIVPPDVEVGISETAPYVSRAGIKLAHALNAFGVSCEGLNVLDVGASTGGFTDCLLRHGAKHVWAVDVGHGQLADSLRKDERVVSLEGINARQLSGSILGRPAELAVVDVSFISQRLIWPAILDCLTEQAPIISLVKPQFEAGRSAVGKGGIIRDSGIHQRVLDELEAYARTLGLQVIAKTESPILGGDGNKEFFFLLTRTGPVRDEDSEQAVDR